MKNKNEIFGLAANILAVVLLLAFVLILLNIYYFRTLGNPFCYEEMHLRPLEMLFAQEKATLRVFELEFSTTFSITKIQHLFRAVRISAN